MSTALITESLLTNTADAIRSKLGVQTQYYPSEFPEAILSISGGGSATLQSKTATPTGSEQTIAPDTGYDGLSSVTIEGVTTTNLLAPNIVSGVTVKVGTATDDDSIASVTGTAEMGTVVSVVDTTDSGGGTIRTITAVSLQDDTVSSSVLLNGYTAHDSTGAAITGSYVPSGTDTSDATMTSGNQMLSGVTAYSKGTKYTGTIVSKSSSDLTTSGATVTAPAGYYASAASKSVASGSATTPSTTITANPSISVNSSGLITATASASQSVTPTVSAGYVSSGTAGTITVNGSNTQQLTTQAAQTLYPSTTDQTISSGRYLTGTQTVKAVAVSGLSASNIASGVTVNIGDSADADRIMSVTGTLEFVTVYSGTSDPSSSTGENGDIYLKVVS